MSELKQIRVTEEAHKAAKIRAVETGVQVHEAASEMILAAPKADEETDSPESSTPSKP